MFDKIIAYLEKRMENNAINPDPFERRQVAVAALLVEASRMDGHYDAVEQGTIVRLLKDVLNLPANEARTLLSLAEIRDANTYDNWIFCESIKKGYAIPERIDIVKHLWEVALVDGQLSRFETEMIDRVAKELELSDEQAANAKAAALKKN